MKIAIDITPFTDKRVGSHRVRGTGFYLEYLKRSLLKYHPDNEYIFFTRGESVDKSVNLIHYPYFEPFFNTLPRSNFSKTVITVHDLTPLVFPKYFPAGIRGSFNWHIQKLKLRQASGIITDSYSSQNDIVGIAGVEKEKVDVVYLAAADEFRKLDRGDWKDKIIQKYSLPEEFVLYVGDVTWNKNLPRLIHAVKEINLSLVMVGKTLTEKLFNAKNPWNKDLLEVNKLADGDRRIIKLGFVSTDDLVSLYNSAVLFVMPSLYEGFGLPIIEAMQCGCPVVTTKGGSITEVGGDAVFYVDEYDTQSIARGISEVFFTKKMQDELSLKGLQQAKKFNWKKTADKTIGVYKKVLST